MIVCLIGNEIFIKVIKLAITANKEKQMNHYNYQEQITFMPLYLDYDYIQEQCFKQKVHVPVKTLNSMLKVQSNKLYQAIEVYKLIKKINGAGYQKTKQIKLLYEILDPLM